MRTHARRLVPVLAGAFFVLSVCSPRAAAQTVPAARKVYISVDMEGISGIADSGQLSSGQPEYNRYRKLMVEDVNAAVEGAFAGGAAFVLVNDSHGSMRNVAIEDLDARADLISHSFKPYGMLEGLDDTFDALVFIGYHAKAGSPIGFAAHTGSGVVRDLRVNGRSIGKAGLNALLAAWYGVPVVLGTGDQVAAEQIKDAAPRARVVVVKRALNQRAVELRPLSVVRDEIAKAAAAAVREARRAAPQRSVAYHVELQFNGTAHADVAEGLPQIERTAPDTIAFTVPTMPQAYRLIRILYRYLNPD